jgi:small subunit ribosomal protein S16
VVRIRLKKLGRRHQPSYRVVAIDSRRGRSGVEVEVLGSYDPINKDEGKVLTVNSERVKHWLSVGAQPSDTVRTLLKGRGLL